MLFNSINFIFVFMTAFLISYFLVENKYKNVVIFLYSIAFYIIGNVKTPINVIILVADAILNYLLYKLMLKTNVRSAKIFTILIVIMNVIMLLVFRLNILNIISPAGFSFYTLGIISFIIDMYKSRIASDSENQNAVNVFLYMSYIIFFPKLLSGPITKFSDFRKDYMEHKINIENIYAGFCYFCIGLAYKCFLSANVSYIINQINVYGYESISFLTAWVGVFAYTMQLYFDFAGYSLMAIGIAKIIGFSLPDNFNLPFFAVSISDFWRRWHITLGRFYKEYIYIPMGGNRCSKTRQCINLLVVWIFTAIWHGLKLNYLIWAMIICIFIIMEKIFLNVIYKKNFIIGKIVVLIIIPVTMVIFSIENITELRIYLLKLIDFASIQNNIDFTVIMKRYFKIFIIGIIFMTRFPKLIYERVKKYKLIMLVLCVIMLVVSVYMINVGAHDTFRYFAF